MRRRCWSGLGATMDEAAAVLERLTEADLVAPYEIQGYHVSGLEAVYQVVEHFGLHYDRLRYIAKSLSGRDLGFYRDSTRRAGPRSNSAIRRFRKRRPSSSFLKQLDCSEVLPCTVSCTARNLLTVFCRLPCCPLGCTRKCPRRRRRSRWRRNWMRSFKSHAYGASKSVQLRGRMAAELPILEPARMGRERTLSRTTRRAASAALRLLPHSFCPRGRRIQSTSRSIRGRRTGRSC